MFVIIETEEGNGGPSNYGPYMKMLTINFATGAYSFKKQINPFVATRYYTDVYSSLHIYKAID